MLIYIGVERRKSHIGVGSMYSSIYIWADGPLASCTLILAIEISLADIDAAGRLVPLASLFG